MASTIVCDTNEKTTILECFADAIDAIDPECTDSIIEFSREVKKLSNNKEEISAALCKHLVDFSSNDYGGINYSPNSFILSPVHPYFLIRANIWLPLTSEKDRLSFEENLFAYHRAHNHNFHFLTVGHFGPGYSTDIYSYERDNIIGYLGENVSMRNIETTTLTPGKVMFYHSGKDVHTQFPAASVSVSINLVVVNDDDRLRDQYFFSPSTQTITGFSDTLASKRVSLLTIAAYLANDNMIEILADIATLHPCHRTRLQAFESLVIAKPSELEHWAQLAKADTNPVIRNHMAQSLCVSNPQSSFDSAFMQLV